MSFKSAVVGPTLAEIVIYDSTRIYNLLIIFICIIQNQSFFLLKHHPFCTGDYCCFNRILHGLHTINDSNRTARLSFLFYNYDTTRNDRIIVLYNRILTKANNFAGSSQWLRKYSHLIYIRGVDWSQSIDGHFVRKTVLLYPMTENNNKH